MIDKQTAQHDRSSLVSLCLLWSGVLCAGLLLYGWTVQQGISWQDSGMFQWRVLAGDYIGNLGLVLAHPLYIAIGRLFLFVPFGSELTLLNFCSGVGMAIALANVSVLGFLITGRRWIGLMTAGLLAVMHTPWSLSTIAEVYTWNAAFFTAELILFITCIRKPCLLKLFGLFLCNGLNFGVHNMALLSLPVYGTWVLIFVFRRRLSPVSIVVAGAAFVSGSAPLVWLVVQDFLQTGSLQLSLESLLVGRYAANVLNVSSTHPLVAVNAALSSLNFLHFGLPLGGVGLIVMTKSIGKPLAWSLLTLLCIHGLFFGSLSLPDQFTFIVPTLVLFSLGMAVGMDVVARKSAGWKRAVVVLCLLSIVCMPLLYASVPPTLKKLDINVSRSRVLPFRDEIRYWIVPWKHTEDSAEQFARAALLQAAPDGLIVCDSTSYYPLILMKERISGVEGVSIEGYSIMARRYGSEPDALVVLLRERPVFIVSPVLNFITGEYRQDFDFSREPDRILYRLSVAGHGAS